MNRFDFRIETYEIHARASQDSWGARPHVWEMTTDRVKPIVLDEQLGHSQEEAAEKAARAAKKYIADRTVEDI